MITNDHLIDYFHFEYEFGPAAWVPGIEKGTLKWTCNCPKHKDMSIERLKTFLVVIKYNRVFHKINLKNKSIKQISKFIRNAQNHKYV